MGIDKNTIIGFSLIGVLLISMMWMNKSSEKAYEADKKKYADSIAATLPKVDTVAAATKAKLDLKKTDSLLNVKQTVGFAQDSAKAEMVT